MKNLIIAFTLIISSTGFASINGNRVQEYKFKFNFKGAIYEYKQTSMSYEKAYELAAKACYKHYKNGEKLTEDKGLDIIDVCANPRS